MQTNCTLFMEIDLMDTASKEPSFIALSQRSDLQSEDGNEVLRDDSKLIAFYLPQYHRIPENSEWWGPGFTEWTSVVKGKPNFSDHYQPHLPRELGFYDLTHADVLCEQAEFAKLYGVYGFCFYYYWFSGRRILERPLENFLKSDIDIKFCLCWANENWTRTWDGDTRSVLLSQNYAEGDDESFIASLVDYFNDERYIRVDQKPMLVVYRAKEIPDPSSSFVKWRSLAKSYGFEGLHIVVVDFYDISSPDEVDADALVEFPPHKFNGPQSRPDKLPTIINPDFTGGVVDYSKVIAQSAQRPAPSFKLYRGIIPSWDNTARRQNTPTIVVNAQPELYGEWLGYLRAYTREHNPSKTENFIFINAWNEWGEGCHLEPDQKWGLQYLEQTLKSSYYIREPKTLDKSRDALLRKVAEKMISHLDVADGDVQAVTEQMTLKLSNYRSVGNFTHKVAAKLIKWPLVYGSTRVIYRFFCKVRG